MRLCSWLLVPKGFRLWELQVFDGYNRPVGQIREVVMAHAEEIKGLLAFRHAREIKVFGSVARSEDIADSDVDFLVEFAPGASILDQIHLENDLRELLGCSVDVIPIGALKPRDAHVIAEAVPL